MARDAADVDESGRSSGLGVLEALKVDGYPVRGEVPRRLNSTR